MNILGIIALGTSPAACLLADGKCLAFVEEERFTRLKGSAGMFPARAVAYCLSYAGLPLDAVDRIAFGWDATKYPLQMLHSFGVNYIKYKGREMRAFHKERDAVAAVFALECLMEYHPARLRAKILEGLRCAGLKGRVPKIEFVPHHLAHAYSAYFCSSFDRAGVLTIDGSGEDICTQLSIGEGDKLRKVESSAIPHSLGWFYAAMTEYLGFVPYRDEGKMMALAALGEQRKNDNKWIGPLSKILRIKNGYYEVDPIYTNFGGHYYGKRYSDEMARFITSIDPQAAPVAYGEKAAVGGFPRSKYLLDVYTDIAWAAQELLERAAVMLAKKMVDNYGISNLCIAGGVGLNCKMNGEILRRSGCADIFVQPASNDAGAALGAAMYVAQAHGDNIRVPLKNTYFGPAFSQDDIRGMLEDYQAHFKEIDDPAAAGARLLAEGKTIGWFQGRMEFGARALGNRSIIASPLIAGIKERVNAHVKYRESWRPLCPSISEEERGSYLEDPKEASFMTVAYRIKKPMAEKLKAVVHVDGSVRPQIVKEDANPLFYSLLSHFKRHSGHAIVMNTSFNVRGEPIVCNPQEAIRCFYTNGLDALMIGNFLLEKG